MRTGDEAATTSPAPAAATARRGDAPLDESTLQHLVGFKLARADVPARRAFKRHIGTPLKLRPVDFSLLMLLLANASATPKQVAQALAVPPPKVTGLVDVLVERGLVARRRNAADGRAQDLLLTARGRELATRAHRLSLTMESAMLQALSPAERAMLGELLAKLAQA